MKKVYVLMVVFGIWCIGSAFWYIFSVKGLTQAPAQINPHDSGLAIAEILIMVLISVLIGFAIAWYLRDDSIKHKQHEIHALLGQQNSAHQTMRALEQRTQKAEHTLERARATFREDFFQVTREKEKLQAELDAARQEMSNLQSTVQNLQQANTQLEKTVSNERQTKHELEMNLQQALIKQEHKNISGFTLDRMAIATEIEKEDIDDLKEIKGIGPVIEKKLNILGIVSFKQLSELPTDAIEHIAHAIKFFPDRIRRDQWVTQAKQLLSQKLRRG